MTNRRVWEIDLLRGVAIILMVVFHTVYDLNEFLGLDITYNSGFWYWVGKISALIFIFISGISSGFSKGVLRRGLKVLAIGLGITLVTYFALEEQYIRFGILHFLGTCMLLYPLFKALNFWLLAVLTAAVAYLAPYVSNYSVQTGLLLPLGFKYKGFVTADYYPLFPYLAVFLLGVMAYKLYYHKKKSLLGFSWENRIIRYVSKRSLFIYVVHQPVILGVLLLIESVI